MVAAAGVPDWSADGAMDGPEFTGAGVVSDPPGAADV
jgi:hypothetical protein